MAAKAQAIPGPEVNFTLRHPPYSYLHLSVKTVNSAVSPPDLDDITARSYLTSALQQFLGLTGAAIPVDILKVQGQSVWIRVPDDDGNAVAAAISQWSSPSNGLSLRIEARASWLGALVAKERTGPKLWTLET